MLQVKEAVKASVAVFEELFPPEVFREPRLEEVSLSDDERSWRITLSYKNPDMEEELAAQRAESKSLAAAFGGNSSRTVPTRHFKSVTINSADGSLVGIKSA